MEGNDEDNRQVSLFYFIFFIYQFLMIYLSTASRIQATARRQDPNNGYTVVWALVSLHYRTGWGSRRVSSPKKKGRRQQYSLFEFLLLTLFFQLLMMHYYHPLARKCKGGVFLFLFLCITGELRCVTTRYFVTPLFLLCAHHPILILTTIVLRFSMTTTPPTMTRKGYDNDNNEDKWPRRRVSRCLGNS